MAHVEELSVEEIRKRYPDSPRTRAIPLRTGLFGAGTRTALAEFEESLKARQAELTEQEGRKLRLLVARRWKVVA